MMKFGLAAAAAVLLTGAAAPALTPEQIVARHNDAVARSDVDAIMADYADDAVVLQAGQSAQGKAEIRKLMERLFPKPAPGAAPGGASAMKITRRWAEGNVGYFTWEMPGVNGTDEFIVRDGKIAVQAVFINRAPPQ